MVPNKTLVALTVNIVLLLGCLYWVSENLSMTTLLASFKTLPLSGMIYALLLNIAVLVVYGMRFARLSGAHRITSCATVTVGFGLNNVMPFRLGEVAKLAYAKQRFGMDASIVIIATGSEKFLDLVALFFSGLIVTQMAAASFLNDKLIYLAAAILCLSLTVVIGARIAGKHLHSSSRLREWLHRGAEVLHTQRNPTSLAWLLACTAVIWLITYAAVYVMFKPMFPSFEIVDAVILTLILALAVAIPGVPAGIGAVEAGMVTYLCHMFDAKVSIALAAAVSFHVIAIAPQLIATALLLAESTLRCRGIVGSDR